MSLRKKLGTLVLGLGLLGTSALAQEAPKILGQTERLLKTHSKFLNTSTSSSVELVLEKKLSFKTDKGNLKLPLKENITYWKNLSCNDKPEYAPLKGEHIYHIISVGDWPIETQLLEFHDFNCDGFPDKIKSSGADIINKERFVGLFFEDKFQVLNLYRKNKIKRQNLKP